ncbi:hypothetical protein [Rathayibacter toxicus]|uniref:hypothetical protein n=1 Tax=Rathayibacter toxicus TaxID=145458 RepID=UPI001C0586F5|nr:hypothetical protein [Rathayibacter toxicus]QWL30258.1 hypothetical protein E2R34_05520 [Rathayibacter toxicus]
MKSTLYATAIRRTTVIAFALVVGFGSLLTPLAAQAETSVPVSSIVQASPASAASWVPYDNAAITSEGNCEARRQWLIANVNWMTQTNSDCWSFYQPGCPGIARVLSFSL